MKLQPELDYGGLVMKKIPYYNGEPGISHEPAMKCPGGWTEQNLTEKRPRNETVVNTLRFDAPADSETHCVSALTGVARRKKMNVI